MQITNPFTFYIDYQINLLYPNPVNSSDSLVATVGNGAARCHFGELEQVRTRRWRSPVCWGTSLPDRQLCAQLAGRPAAGSCAGNRAARLRDLAALLVGDVHETSSFQPECVVTVYVVCEKKGS